METAQMDYLRKVNLQELNDTQQRWSQALLYETLENGSVTIMKTPVGGGSPAGLHWHTVDQIFYVLSGQMNVRLKDPPMWQGRELLSSSRRGSLTATGTQATSRPFT